MGRKGVSKGKTKTKSGPVSKTNNSGSMADLAKDKAAPLNRDGVNPSAGANKKHKKGN